ncbi:MAG: FixH family protein [Rhizobiaceae bacterium]
MSKINMMGPNMDKQPFRFTGMHMLACMVAFFGVIIAVNVTMATFASSSWTGLVVKNSYVASQKFNAELAAAEAQAELGWKSQISYDNQRLQFSLFDRQGSSLKPGTVIVSLGRPAFEQKDQQIKLTADASGLYATQIALEDGSWSLRIDASAEQQQYRRDLRLFVKQGTGRIE